MGVKVYLLYVRNRDLFLGHTTRTLKGVYGSSEKAEAARTEILLTTTNGPDDVTIDEMKVIE